MKCPNCGYTSELLEDFHWEIYNQKDIPPRHILTVTCSECGYRKLAQIDDYLACMFSSWFIAKNEFGNMKDWHIKLP